VDIYSIGFKVDSRQVKTAQKDLGGMGRQAKTTGDSVKRFGRDVDKSTRTVQGMNRGLDLAKRALAGFAAALSIRELQQFTQAALASAQNIERQSQALGVSAEEFQRLSFAFRQFGADSADISDALNTLADRAEDAKAGTQSFVDDFELIGIEVDELRGKNPDELFRLFAREVANVEDPTRRAAGVVRILGDDVGRRLLPLLQQGEQGLDRLGNQAQVASEEVIESSARIKSDLTELGTELETGLQNVFLESAARNEEQIRSLVATTLRGMATIADFGDEVGGPLGAGLIGRVLFGKKGAVIATLLTGAVQTVNAFIDRFNETTGGAIVRLEERAQQLKNTIEGMPEAHPVRQTAEADLQRVQSKLDALNAQRMDSIEIENQYQKALKSTGDVGEDVGDVLREAARQFEAGTPNLPDTDAQGGGITLIEGPEELEHVNLLLDDVQSKTKAATSQTSLFDDAMQDVRESLSDIARTMTDDVSDGLTDIIMQAESASDVFKSLANQIARTLIQEQVADPFAREITGAASSLFKPTASQTIAQGGSAAPPPSVRGGGGGGLFSGIGDFFGGFFANGGNVSGGQAHVVGERGPEMFVPRQDGQIVPNSQMGGGGGDVTVNIINQSGEKLQSEQQNKRRGPNGEMTVDVMVKSSMERLDSQVSGDIYQVQLNLEIIP